MEGRRSSALSGNDDVVNIYDDEAIARQLQAEINAYDDARVVNLDVYAAGGYEAVVPGGAAGIKRQGTRIRRLGTVRDYGEQYEFFETPEHKVWMVYAIFGLNVLMFTYSVYLNNWEFEDQQLNPMIGPSNAALVKAGAKLKYLIVTKGESYRLVAPMFLHAGIIHLLMNMSVLLRLGADMEKAIGWFRVSLIYFSAGIFGTIASAIFIPNIIGVGASGALYGLVGSMFGDFIYNYQYMVEGRCKYFMQIVLSSAVGLIIGLLPFLDNFTHAGGWLIGIIASCAFLSGAFRQPDGKPTRKLLLTITSLALLFILFTSAISVLYGDQDPDEWCNFCRSLSCVETPYWECNTQVCNGVVTLEDDQVVCAAV